MHGAALWLVAGDQPMAAGLVVAANLRGWQAVTSDRDFDPLAHIQRLRSRIVYDALGVRWTVQEVLGPSYSRRTSRSLVFAADGIMRRVRSFPENWVDLDDDALLRLSEGW